jgi:hypothetical protein
VAALHNVYRPYTELKKKIVTCCFIYIQLTTNQHERTIGYLIFHTMIGDYGKGNKVEISIFYSILDRYMLKISLAK